VLLSGEVRADTQNPTPKEGRPFYNVWIGAESDLKTEATLLILF